MKGILAYIRLGRPEQWIKNVLIFLPLFFHQQLGMLDGLRACVIAFAGFSLVASSVYCFNDLYDVEADRLHPVKSKRPLASGMIGKSGAMVMMGILFLAGMLIVSMGLRMWNVVFLFLFYFMLNVSYTLWLKHFSIIDACIIAIGFVIRVVVGGVACNIPLSHWIIIMTFLLALFLAFAKRRDDVVYYKTTGVKLRHNLLGYNVDFLNAALSILATITIVAYVMYAVSPEVVRRIGSEYLYLTSFFVIVGILRYLQLTFVELKSGDPTTIFLHDRFMQCCILGWVLLFGYFIYF